MGLGATDSVGLMPVVGAPAKTNQVVTASWDAAAGVSGYLLFKGTNAGTYDSSTGTTTNRLTLTLPIGPTYHWAVASMITYPAVFGTNVFFISDVSPEVVWPVAAVKASWVTAMKAARMTGPWSALTNWTPMLVTGTNDLYLRLDIVKTNL